MARLEDLTRGAIVKGILPGNLVTVVDLKWYGANAAELTYKDATGRLGNELLYRDREIDIEIESAGLSNTLVLRIQGLVLYYVSGDRPILVSYN